MVFSVKSLNPAVEGEQTKTIRLLQLRNGLRVASKFAMVIVGRGQIHTRVDGSPRGRRFSSARGCISPESPKLENNGKLVAALEKESVEELAM